MRTSLLRITILGSALLLVAAWGYLRPKEEASAASGFGVVELFTSEGCSSCPPADRILRELVQEGDESIYALSFHVDYWDRLGWKDPYSRAEFSERQRAYGKKLPAQVYTPQMVFNGQQYCVGSRAQQVTSALSKALEQAPLGELSLSLVNQQRGKLTIRFQAQGLGSSHLLRVALVERNLVVPVKRGENSGRVLEHDHVVRDWQTHSLDRQTHGSIALAIPSDAKPENLAVIAYVQDAESWAIVNAARLGL